MKLNTNGPKPTLLDRLRCLIGIHRIPLYVGRHRTLICASCGRLCPALPEEKDPKEVKPMR